jgi:hypothetical protein
VDLASKTDLAALAVLSPTRANDGQLTHPVFVRCYLNDAAMMEVRNASNPGWAAEGHVKVTLGNDGSTRD